MSGPTMTLADGTVIDMVTGRPLRQSQMIEIPTHQEAVRELTRVRKRVHDLPEPPEKMNAISLVAMYHLFGLSDNDIAYVTGLTEQQVGNIRVLEAFGEIIEAATQNLLAEDTDKVRDLIAANATGAVRTLVDALQSQDEKVSLVAAKDILDRSGHRPADVVEHRHKIDGGLTIEYIKRDPGNDIPALDVTDYKEN